MASTVWLISLCLTLWLYSVTADDCGDWSDWGECTVPCGGGTQHRCRGCVEDETLTSESQQQDCNTDDCVPDCTPWSQWSPCSHTCGPNSRQQRVRQCFTYTGCCRCEPEEETEYDLRRCSVEPCDECESELCVWTARHSMGYLPHPEFCNGYIICLPDGRGGYIKLFKWCTSGSIWNPAILACDHAHGSDCLMSSVPTRPPSTVRPGCPYVPRPGDPSRFGRPGSRRYQSCGDDGYFDATVCTCLPVDRPDDPLVPEPLCDHCLYFPFDSHYNDISCFGAISEVFGGMGFAPGVLNNGATFSGSSRLLVNMFRNWLYGAHGGSELTISVWLYRDCEHPDDPQGLVVNAECETDPTVDLRLVNGGSVQGGVRNGNNQGLNAFSLGHLVPCREWHHVAMVYKSNRLKLYIDCVKVDQSYIQAPIKSSSVSLSIGHTGANDNEFYKGIMDELYICRRAFSTSELTAQCNLHP